MKTLERTACLGIAAVVLAGCHETLTQLEPQFVTPAGAAAPGLAGSLPGLEDFIANDTLEITPPLVARRLIAAAEEALAATEALDPESVLDARGSGNGDDAGSGRDAGSRNPVRAEDRERARELIRWARAALASGDHVRAIQRGYYAWRLLGTLP